MLKIELPFTEEEWKKGQKYVFCKMKEKNVRVIKTGRTKENNTSILKAHKLISIENRIPGFLKKFIPKYVFEIDEYSTYIENVLETDKIKMVNMEMPLGTGENIFPVVEHRKEYIASGKTVYRSKSLDEDTFNIVIETFVLGEKRCLCSLEQFSGECNCDVEEIDFRTWDGNIEKIGERDYRGDWKSKYGWISCYKGIKVNINKFGFSFLSAEVEKIIRKRLVDIQKSIVETYPEWKDMEISDMENL